MKLFEIMRANARPPSIYLEQWMYHDREKIKQWLEKNHLNCSIDQDLELIAHETINLGIDWGADIISSDEFKNLGTNRDKILFAGEKSAPDMLVRHGSDILLPVQFKSSDGFYIDNLGITSLIGCPYIVHGEFRVVNVPLKDLHGFPEIVRGNVIIRTLHDMADLSGIKPDAQVTREFQISAYHGHYIGNLVGIPKNIKSLTTFNVKSFKGINVCKELKSIYITASPNPCGLLNILTLPDPAHRLTVSVFSPSMGGKQDANPDLLKAVKILNTHLRGDRDMLDCQEEMRSSGLREYGKT